MTATRCKRRSFPKGFTQVDNRYLRDWAKLLGPVCTAAYAHICSHYNHATRESVFTSIRAMADMMGTEKSTAHRAIQTLLQHGLIDRHEYEKRRGGKTAYTYTPALDVQPPAPKLSHVTDNSNGELSHERDNHGGKVVPEVVPHADSQLQRSQQDPLPTIYILEKQELTLEPSGTSGGTEGAAQNVNNESVRVEKLTEVAK